MDRLKSFVLGLGFVQDAIRQAGIQAGIDAFRLAEKDVLATFQDDVEVRADELALEKVAALLSPVDTRMVVAVDPRTHALLVGGERLEEGRIANLKSEAEFLVQSELWRLLNETPKALAEKAMFVDDGKIESQLLKGRAVLFMLATQKKIIDTIRSIKSDKDKAVG